MSALRSPLSRLAFYLAIAPTLFASSDLIRSNCRARIISSILTSSTSLFGPRFFFAQPPHSDNEGGAWGGGGRGRRGSAPFPSDLPPHLIIDVWCNQGQPGCLFPLKMGRKHDTSLSLGKSLLNRSQPQSHMLGSQTACLQFSFGARGCLPSPGLIHTTPKLP